jgi:hypothetical protein
VIYLWFDRLQNRYFSMGAGAGEIEGRPAE